MESGEYIHHSVGRCNREVKCGYHYSPKQYFQNNRLEYVSSMIQKTTSPPKELRIDTIEKSILDQTISSQHPNNFLTYLNTLFDKKTVHNLQRKYHIGTSKIWKGATIFWQVDYRYGIRSGKIMLYDVNSGKRIKKPFPHITWVHKAMKLSNYNLKQCFFGEHLLKSSTNPIAIVESEKTAVIASVYLPEFTWLASGSLSNLNYEKTKVLKDRQVILFPDLGAYDTWKAKIPSLYPNANYQISDLLERKATAKEKLEGWDIADYLVGLDLG